MYDEVGILKCESTEECLVFMFDDERDTLYVYNHMDLGPAVVICQVYHNDLGRAGEETYIHTMDSFAQFFLLCRNRVL